MEGLTRLNGHWEVHSSARKRGVALEGRPVVGEKPQLHSDGCGLPVWLLLSQSESLRDLEETAPISHPHPEPCFEEGRMHLTWAAAPEARGMHSLSWYSSLQSRQKTSCRKHTRVSGGLAGCIRTWHVFPFLSSSYSCLCANLAQRKKVIFRWDCSLFTKKMFQAP